MKKVFVAGSLFLVFTMFTPLYSADAQSVPNIPSDAYKSSSPTSGFENFDVTAARQNLGSNTSSGGACSSIASNGLNGVVGCLVGMFNIAIYLMMAASVVYTVYGAFLMITNEEKRENGKQTIYHGIIGLFVMISIWGFVNILDKTFNLSKIGSDQVIPKSFIK